MNKLPISIGIMTWRDTDSLYKLLKNYKKAGLFDISDDIHVLLQDGTQEDIDVVRQYPQLRYTVVENLGNGGGISYLCRETRHDYFVFLENDWFIHPENNIYADIKRGLELVQQGFQKVDFRSIKRPGWANLVGTSKKEMELSGKPKIYWDVIAFMFLHWLGDNPSKDYPDIIHEGEDYVWGDSLYFPWGDNPFIIHKSLIMNNWEGFNQTLSPERTQMQWWRDNHFKVARLKDGPFYHFDTKKYNPLLRNLFNTSIKEVQAGFSYSPNKKGFYLRGVLFTGELFEIDSMEDSYFVGDRNVWPVRLDNKSHVYEINTLHKYIKSLEILIYPEELNNDFIVVPKSGESYNLGPIKNLIADEFNLHKPERNIVVVDDFYLNPYEVRDFALSKNFKESGIYKYRITQTNYHAPFIKDKFEELIGKKITNWTDSRFNGSFQYCTSEDKLEYNVGSHDYFGIVFLTPEAPPETGTVLFRCKRTGNYEYEKGEWEPEYQTTFKSGHLDKTQLEEIDRIGNRFNRLVIFKARNIHAATEYFGDNPRNSRLVQIFMFDAE
jgi:hypothetical protein